MLVSTLSELVVLRDSFIGRDFLVCRGKGLEKKEGCGNWCGAVKGKKEEIHMRSGNMGQYHPIASKALF